MPRITLTKLEKETIQYAFESTRKFWKTPIVETISLKNINNMVRALYYLTNKIGVGTKTRGDIIKGIFDKFGLCSDGTTTKEERAKQLAEARKRKLEQKKRANDDRLDRLKRAKIRIENEIERFTKSDEQIEAEITEAELQEQAKLKIEMSALRNRKQRAVEMETDNFLEALGISVDDILDKLAPPPPPSMPETGKKTNKKQDNNTNDEKQ